jgi:ABC-type polysaccharide/polyol phosphate export permease
MNSSWRGGWSNHALVQLTLARFREFWREPEAIFWTFVFPLLLAAGLGLAFRNRPPEVLNVGAVSQPLVQALKAEPLLAVRDYDASRAVRALRHGQVALIAAPAAHGGVVYHYDNTNPEGRTARLLADAAVQRAAGRVDPVPVSDRIIVEPGSRYIDFLIPGLLGMNLMGSAIWGMGFAIVDARRKKLIKRLVATPMPRAYYLLSFALARLLLLIVEVGVLVGFGVYVFQVPVRGSWATLALICLLGSLAFGAIGLLIAARPQTIEAASGWMNLVMMPMWVLSGVFFSAQRFPEALQPVIRLLPLTAVNDALRANMLQGTGASQLLPELAVLAGYGVACFAIAVRAFRWR